MEEDVGIKFSRLPLQTLAVDYLENLRMPQRDEVGILRAQIMKVAMERLGEALSEHNVNELVRNTLFAIVIDDVIDRMVHFPGLGDTGLGEQVNYGDELDLYSLVPLREFSSRDHTYIDNVTGAESTQILDPFDVLSRGMLVTGHAHFGRYQAELGSPRADYVDTLIDRLVDSFGFKVDRNFVWHPMRNGFDTGRRTMAGFLRLVKDMMLSDEHRDEFQKLCEASNKKPEQVLTEVADRSFPVVASYAWMYLPDFLRLLDLTSDVGSVADFSPKFKPEAFEVGERSGELVIRLPMSVRREAQNSAKVVGFRPHHGCPAHVKFPFHEASALRRLWDWHMQLAPYVYRAALDEEV